VNSNLLGFSSVLQVAATEKIPNLLYASSSSIYGEHAAIPYSESERNLFPSSFYGATKLSNEILAKSLIERSSVKARGLRFFTVYGPKGRPDMAYFRIISKLINNKKFDLYGDGSVQRDFTFIEDCVETIYKLSQELNSHDPGFHDVVNVGGGHPVSINDLIALSSRLVGSNLSIQNLDEDKNDVAKTMADPTYLKSLVGSYPSTRIEEGIKKTIDWAINIPDKRKLSLWTESTE
jgi:UDP-glucuronate 4-epimerase